MKRKFTFNILIALLMSATAYAQDMAMSSLSIPAYVDIANAPYTITGTVRNLGSDTINSFDINYAVDGVLSKTISINQPVVPNGGSYNFSLLNSWNPNLPKTYVISAWASNLNGGNDINPVNDTLTKTVQVLSGFVARNALHEVFTSSTCPPCNPGNANLNAIFGASSQTPVVIKYQMSWPGSGDPYYTAEGGVRRTYYGVSGVPNMAVDGGWNGNTNSYSNGLLDQYSAVPAIVEMEANYTVDEPNQTVSINFAIRPFQDLIGNNRLHVAIIEKLAFNNAKTNGETSFDNVMKKMLPNGNGTSIGNLIQGIPLTYEYSYTFNGSYRLPANANSPINHATEHSVEEFSDLDIVTFVQANGSRKVHHASHGTVKPTILDLSMVDFSTSDSANVNTAVSIDGIIRNNQATVVNSFDIVYNVDGGTPQRETISGLNLAKGDTYTFAHGTTWNPSNAGIYKVEVSIDNINGAGQNTTDDITLNNEMFKYFIVSTPSGIPAREVAKTIKVFPNPSEGLVYINSASAYAKSVEVYTLMGEKVDALELGAKGMYNLDMSTYQSGIYMLRFNTDNGAFSQRIIID